MRASLLVVPALLMLLGVSMLGVKEGTRTEAESQDPKFAERNELLRPEAYREWIYLSSGLG